MIQRFVDDTIICIAEYYLFYLIKSGNRVCVTGVKCVKKLLSIRTIFRVYLVMNKNKFIKYKVFFDESEAESSYHIKFQKYTINENCLSK